MRCVMDTSAPDIQFDEHGMCNYCIEFLGKSSHILFKSELHRTAQKDALIAEIKQTGRDRRYDCIVGLSGGVDSAWALYMAVQSGLRPLAVHMDNGWNSELAQNNIENLVRKLGVDLYTHVIDWHEYRKLMQAFFDADVIDVELLYDNAMLAVNYQQAARHGVKWILSGHNLATEGMRIPTTWNWFKFDKRNIRALARRYDPAFRPSTFPSIGTLDLFYFKYLRNIHWVPFLDHFDYQKNRSLNFLEREFGYKPYPYKHYESIFTRFYQGYQLPKKFGIDKRRVHFSTLIISEQMTRNDAMKKLEHDPYPSIQELESDIKYFLKKMQWSRSQLNEYLSRKEVPHENYNTEKPLWDFLGKIQLFLKRQGKNINS